MIKKLRYFFSVFKSLYLINVGYNACKAVCLKRQSNSQLNFFYNTLSFKKKVWNQSVPELANALFFSLWLSGRGIFEFEWIRYITFSHDIILFLRLKNLEIVYKWPPNLQNMRWYKTRFGTYFTLRTDIWHCNTMMLWYFQWSQKFKYFR